MSENVDDFLAHYGVTGMKWGKRQSSSGEAKPKMSREKKIAIAVGIGSAVAVGAVIALSIMNGKSTTGISIPNIPVQTLTTNKTAQAGRATLIANAAAMSAKESRHGIADIPVGMLATSNKTASAGKANLIFNAAAMSAKDTAKAIPRKDIADISVGTLTTNRTMLAGKANLIFNAASMAANNPAPTAPRKTLRDKVEEKVFNTAKAVAMDKVMKMDYDDFKAMSNPQPRVGLVNKAKGAAEDKVNEIVIKKVRDISTAQAASIDKAKKSKRAKSAGTGTIEDLIRQQQDLKSSLSRSKL